MANRENNTMAEGLDKMMKQIAQMKQMPDADMPFLINLETGILDYLKPPTGAEAGPQQAPGGGMPGAMGAVMGGGGPPMGGPGPGMPNPDELRRTLTMR